MAKQWVLNGQNGFEASLEFQENVREPTASGLGPQDVLVEIHAASLNYREIMMSESNIKSPVKAGVVPGCDGAGLVKAVGSSVQEFSPGDRVVTFCAPSFAEANGDDLCPSLEDAPSMLGQGSDGTLRTVGIFSEKALIHAPKSLNALQAATLTCNWTTVWNVLFGIKGKQVEPGSWVLVQGTGGVSIAALQLATAAGATVVATTSTEAKAARLRELGAKYTVNYSTNPENWGQLARSMTPNERGFDIVVDIGGNQTLPQSLAAIRVDGVVATVGQVGDNSSSVPLMEAFLHTCMVRGVLAGSRSHLREVVRYIDEKGIKPAIDDVVFELAEAKEAYRRLNEKKHFSKVVLRFY